MPQLMCKHVVETVLKLVFLLLPISSELNIKQLKVFFLNQEMDRNSCEIHEPSKISSIYRNELQFAAKYRT